MNVLLMLLVGLLPVDDESRKRGIVRDNIQADGQVSTQLAAQTGWARVLGCRWQMWVNVEGKYRSVRPDQVFRTGQAFQIKVTADTDLWIYVLNRDSVGNEVVLLPDENEEHMRIRQGETVTIPPDGPFRFVDPPGTEHFRIIASPVKLTWVKPRELFDLEMEHQQTQADKKKALVQKKERSKGVQNLMARQKQKFTLQQSLEQVLEKGIPAGARSKDTVLVPPPTENGQQVLQASANPGHVDPIVIDVELRHRY